MTGTDWLITFGFDYRDIPHPVWHRAHPDGYVRIIGMTELEAREFAANTFGPGLWAGIYPTNETRMARFPLGCLMTVTTENAA